MDAQIEQLKRLAEEAADDGAKWFSANPQAILALLTEVEAGRKDRERLDALEERAGHPKGGRYLRVRNDDDTLRGIADAIIAAQQQ